MLSSAVGWSCSAYSVTRAYSICFHSSYFALLSIPLRLLHNFRSVCLEDILVRSLPTL